MVMLLATALNTPTPERPSYSGDLNEVPQNVADITNFSVGQLKEILKYHNVYYKGLVLRVFLLRQKRAYTVLLGSIRELKSIIESAKDLIIQEHFISTEIPCVYRVRSFQSAWKAESFVV